MACRLFYYLNFLDLSVLYLVVSFVLIVVFIYCSAFHLSYNMLLNQLRSEDGNPENLLRNSFYQFQADRAIPDLEVSLLVFHHISSRSSYKIHDNHVQKQIKILEEERSSIVIEEEDSLDEYYSLLQQYKSLKKDVRDIVLSPKYCLPFLQPGRLVSVQCARKDESLPSFSIKDDVTWGVIINFERVKGSSEGEMSSHSVSTPKFLFFFFPVEVME